MPSTSSSPDECPHTDRRLVGHEELPPGFGKPDRRFYHCPDCKAEFHIDDAPKDTLPRGGAEGVHVHEWGTWDCIGLDRAEVWIRRCLCGASQSRSEKPEDKPMAKCKCGHIQGSHDVGGCEVCALDGLNILHNHAFIPALDKPQEPVCTHCQGPHALEDCKGLEEPEADVCDVMSQGGDRCVKDAGHWTPTRNDPHVFDPEDGKPRPIPRRPPYAVAYAVEGGAQYEVAVSGDATVVAEDGVLMVLHPKKPVLAIVRIQPMNMGDESNE